MKKTIALLLMLFLLASVSVAAFAGGTVYTEGTMYFTIGDETITIVGCFGKNESITVPNSIGGIPVNTIASGAFAGNKYLKTVYLPDTITTVEGGAFGGGVAVVYNYNVTEPIATPPAVEEDEEVEIVPSVEVNQTPEATEQPIATGSGTTDLGDEPSSGSVWTPAGNEGGAQSAGSTQGSGTVWSTGEADLDETDEHTAVAEWDVDLDEEEAAAEAVAEAEKTAVTPEPVPTAAPTEEPKAEPTEKPIAEPQTKQEGKLTESTSLVTILLGVAWIVVLVAIIILLCVNAKRKKRMRRAARSKARTGHSTDSDSDR